MPKVDARETRRRTPHRKRRAAVEPVEIAKPADGRERAVRAYDDEAVCLERMTFDYRAAGRIIAQRRALKKLSEAQRDLVDLDAELADALDVVILPEQPVTMTVQRFFLALASRYATNAQLAAFLWPLDWRKDQSRGTGKRSITGNRLDAAFAELRRVPDEEWALMDMRARPVPYRP